MNDDDIYEHLATRINQFYEIKGTDLQYFIEKWHLCKLSKGEYLIKIDSVEKYFYFIHTGVLRGFTIHNGNEITVAFTYDGDFSGAYDSFLDKSASWFSIQALTDAQLLRISYNDLMESFDSHHSIERWGRLFTSEMLIRMAKRQVEARSFTAAEKLNRLLENSPKIFQYVPLKYLASYLGMTPETVSRLRSSLR